MKNLSFNELVSDAKRRTHKILNKPNKIDRIDALGKAAHQAARRLSDANALVLLGEVDQNVKKVDVAFLRKRISAKHRKNMTEVMRATLEAAIIMKLVESRKINRHIKQAGLRLTDNHVVFYDVA